MAGITKAADMARVADIEFVCKFNQGVTALMTVLGISNPQVMAAGTQIVQYSITGTLEETPAEGAEIPISKYTQTKGNTYVVGLEEYRKATTAQAILKSGYDQAVGKTDEKMIKDIQGKVRDKFFTFLEAGTGEATGKTLQAALAAAWGQLASEMGKLDESGTPIYFANPLDVSDYLGGAQINNVETAFGVSYLANFLGLGTLVIDAKVPKGTIYATPQENINMYACDLSALGQAGLDFETGDETGLIGVHHEGRYTNGSAETFADTGLLIFPEVSNFIVKSTIAPGA